MKTAALFIEWSILFIERTVIDARLLSLQVHRWFLT